MCSANNFDVHSIERMHSYRLGDPEKPCDTRTSDLAKDNVLRASLLKVGDGAFVLRSDKTWRYAIVTQKLLSEAPHIKFILNEKGDTKCLSLKH